MSTDNTSFNNLLSTLASLTVFNNNNTTEEEIKNLLAYTIAIQRFNDDNERLLTSEIIRKAFDFAEKLMKEKQERSSN